VLHRAVVDDIVVSNEKFVRVVCNKYMPRPRTNRVSKPLTYLDNRMPYTKDAACTFFSAAQLKV